jgi:hypothetical protein
VQKLSLYGTAALRARQAAAVSVVLIISAAAVYQIKKAPELESDGATVIFFATHQNPRTAEQINNLDASLIATEVMFAETMEKYVWIATGKIQIATIPNNLYNLEYPDYEEQCATLTATANSAATARDGFWRAYRILQSRLMKLQISAGVPARHRIRTYLVGLSGPVSDPGSKGRVLAGLGVLTLIGILCACRFFTLRQNHAGIPRPQFFTLRGNRTQSRRARSTRRRHARRSAARQWMT